MFVKFVLKVAVALLSPFLFFGTVVAGSNQVPVALIERVAFVPKGSNHGMKHIPERYVEAYIRREFRDAPIMIDIARCESVGFRHTIKDGTVARVLRGERGTPNDVGVFQINLLVHSEELMRLGIDPFTLEGNVAFARILFNRNGIRDWASSESCWALPTVETRWDSLGDCRKTLSTSVRKVYSTCKVRQSHQSRRATKTPVALFNMAH